MKSAEVTKLGEFSNTCSNRTNIHSHSDTVCKAKWFENKWHDWKKFVILPTKENIFKIVGGG